MIREWQRWQVECSSFGIKNWTDKSGPKRGGLLSIFMRVNVLSGSPKGPGNEHGDWCIFYTVQPKHYMLLPYSADHLLRSHNIYLGCGGLYLKTKPTLWSPTFPDLSDSTVGFYPNRTKRKLQLLHFRNLQNRASKVHHFSHDDFLGFKTIITLYYLFIVGPFISIGKKNCGKVWCCQPDP